MTGWTTTRSRVLGWALSLAGAPALVVATGQQVVAPPAAAPTGMPDPRTVMRRHAAALGVPDATGSGDFEVLGRSESPTMRVEWRVLVRRQPFSVREDVSSPQDESWHRIVVTDLRHAWELPATPSPAPAEVAIGRSATAEPTASPQGEPLPFADALAVMLRAKLWQLLFAPEDFLQGRPFTAQRGRMPAAPFFHDDFAEHRVAYTLVSLGPLGTNLNGWFDVETGRWLGWQHGPFTDGLHRLRAGRWRDFGGRSLPSVLLESNDTGLGSMHFVDEVRDGLDHADELFAGDPQAAPVGIRDVAPLYVAPRGPAGNGSIYVGETRLDDHGPWWSLLDTGADDVCIEPDIVQQLGLPFIAPFSFPGMGGALSATRHWVSRLTLGSETWLQVDGVSHTTVSAAEMPDGRRVGLIVGMSLLDRHSPVLDLRRGRLLLRGPDAEPLQGIAPMGALPRASAVVQVPIRYADDATRWLAVDVTVAGRSVSALLDSGAPVLLRISAAGLTALGLPRGRDAWEQRGGVPYAVKGLGGPTLPDMLVRLDDVVLHGRDALTNAPIEVVFEQPRVLVSTLADEAPDSAGAAAYLGSGALLPFARIGIDHGRMLLELQPGPDVRIEPAHGEAGKRFVVRAPGG